MSPPGSEGPTSSGIAGTQGPTRWHLSRTSELPYRTARCAVRMLKRVARQVRDGEAPPRLGGVYA